MTDRPADGADTNDNDWGRMSRRLVFLDNDLEADFRASERDRNLGQARFVLWMAQGVQLLFAASDIMLLPEEAVTFITWRTSILTAILAIFQVLTYARYFRTRWPMLMTLAVHVMTISAGLTNIFVEVPALYLSGYMLLILATYLIVPLIFAYCIGTIITATVVFLVMTSFSAVVDFHILSELTLQMLVANLIGIAALHRSERIRRLDHLNKRQLDEQRARYHDLLTSILPAPVADRLERGETVVDEYADATVLFADIVGFTGLAAGARPDQILDMLNRVFETFDALTAKHGLEKIKTIGDGYMVAGGVFGDQTEYLPAMADLALEMQQAAAGINGPDGKPLRLRIGIHTGGLTAGVIGQRRFMYDLWGDTVNTASRMQTLGEPDRIQVSEDVRQRLDGRFELAPRGEIEVKGKGQMATWYLLGRTEDTARTTA